MSRLGLAAAVALVASPLLAPSLAAQDNPFKLPKNKLAAVDVTYAYAGDMTGIAERAISKDRIMSHETTSAKLFGKSTTTDEWTLFTPDSSYSADMTKKTGIKRPNVLPYMEKAYDDLDAASKQRLHQNLQDMAQMIAQAFGTQALSAGEKGETRTYAGEKCQEHSFGAFSVCSMQDAPAIPLHVQGNMLCVNFEQTATTVKRGEPSAAAFTPPSGITFQEDTNLVKPDSMARLYVTYLASQQLADSIAKAKADMAKQQSSSASSSSGSTSPGATGQQRELTPEEKAQAQQACEAFKNFDLGKAMANAGKSVVGEALQEVKQEKEAEAKNKAKDKIKGLFKKPHL